LDATWGTGREACFRLDETWGTGREARSTLVQPYVSG